MNQINYVFAQDSLTVNFSDEDGQRRTKTVAKGTPEYDECKDAIKDRRLEDVPEILMRAEKQVNSLAGAFGDGGVEARNGIVFVDGREVPNDLSKRLLSYAEEGVPCDSLIAFWRNLQNNPSYRAVQGLFRFLDKNHFCFTEDGCFIGYKGLAADFTDMHTRKMDNSIGNVVKLSRNQCDEDPSQACSAGLHVASFNYAHTHYGNENTVVEVKVNPANVVAVPFGDNDEKMRVCEYEVIGMSVSERKEQVFHEPAAGYRGSAASSDEEDDDCGDCGDSDCSQCNW